MSAATIEMQGIVQEYPASEGVNRVIDGVDLTLAGPSINMLMGPSGCGKSTLLRMMGGVRPQNVKTPTQGVIMIDGQPCLEQSPDAITVFQRYGNRPDLTVRQNVDFPFTLKLWSKLPAAERKQRVDEMLVAVGLQDKQQLYPFQLSGGQNQRVALARALALKPRILLMDEPFGALDAQTRQGMQGLLNQLYQSQPCLIVFVTHDVSEALLLGDRVIVLSTQPAKVIQQEMITMPRNIRSETWLRSTETAAMERRILNSLSRKV